MLRCLSPGKSMDYVGLGSQVQEQLEIHDPAQLQKPNLGISFKMETEQGKQEWCTSGQDRGMHQQEG